MNSISILIIDDSKFLSDALKQSFENRGYFITQAFDIASAKNILEEKNFDYALLDLELPDGAGEELLPYLQVYENIRVIILTTSRDKKRREEIFKFGIVVDYIVKERYFADMELAIVRLIEMISTNNNLSILIVDDSKFIRVQLRILLSKRNFKVYDVANGKEALSTIKENKIDAVIIDLEMPVMDGNKLIGAIKRVKDNLLMPLMVVSGTSDPNKIANVLKNGAYDFIKKPYANEELLLKIDKMMQDLKQQRVIQLQQEELRRINLELEMANKKALEASKAKSDFLSVMSHEIRTPLNAIVGFIQILKKMEVDKKKHEFLDIIDKSSKTLTDTINDILDISKIESGNFTIEMIDFNPQEEFTAVINLFQENATKKEIQLINSISTNLPLFVQSDILRIKQIVSNLLSNAIKFTPAHKNVELIVNFDKVKSVLSFVIKDEGIGISKENIENITQAFTQADSSTAREYGGTGLGLSIVEKLLELLDSKLNIESELGKGSRFSFDIKAPVIDNINQDKNSDIDLIFNGKKILIAEDNKTNQLLIKTILEDMNIDTVITNDGVEAEAIFKTNKFDMVLMDINMPNKNGIDAMKDIKKFEKTQRTNTPIIALTANSLHGDRVKYISHGFDGYLTKPIEMEKLINILNCYF
ncbi:MAG: response regulator [Campylobacterota bacterium]|nr:response regulator [Campylobacterota bacterium]